MSHVNINRGLKIQKKKKSKPDHDGESITMTQEFLH